MFESGGRGRGASCFASHEAFRELRELCVGCDTRDSLLDRLDAGEIAGSD